MTLSLLNKEKEIGFPYLLAWYMVTINRKEAVNWMDRIQHCF